MPQRWRHTCGTNLPLSACGSRYPNGCKPLKRLSKEAILPLWRLPEREFQYAALDLFANHGIEEGDLPLLETLITTKSWWDTVDVLAANHCGRYFQSFPYKRVIQRWLKSDHLWLRRAALLFQLRYQELTDAEFLFHSCRHCAQEREPFIQRAIGWALREYGKTNPQAVVDFLIAEKRHLAALSFREASVYLHPHRSQTDSQQSVRHRGAV